MQFYLIIRLRLSLSLCYPSCHRISTFKFSYRYECAFSRLILVFGLKCLFKKTNRPFPASFFFIFVFSTVSSKYGHSTILPMIGFEPQTSGMGSIRSANCATTTGQMFSFLSLLFLFVLSYISLFYISLSLIICSPFNGAISEAISSLEIGDTIFRNRFYDLRIISNHYLWSLAPVIDGSIHLLIRYTGPFGLKDLHRFHNLPATALT